MIFLGNLGIFEMVDTFNNVGSFVLPILLSRMKKASAQEVIKIDDWHYASIFMKQGSILHKRVGSSFVPPMQQSHSLVGGSPDGTVDR